VICFAVAALVGVFSELEYEMSSSQDFAIIPFYKHLRTIGIRLIRFAHSAQGIKTPHRAERKETPQNASLYLPYLLLIPLPLTAPHSLPLLLQRPHRLPQAPPRRFNPHQPPRMPHLSLRIHPHLALLRAQEVRAEGEGGCVWRPGRLG
jgi:hypothetical protein